MKTGKLMPLARVFVSVRDPRSARQVRPDLAELLTVAVCGVLCRADDFAEIEAWGNERIDWLRGFLVLENGIPSHDTFGRVLALLDEGFVAGQHEVHRPRELVAGGGIGSRLVYAAAQPAAERPQRRVAVR